MVKGCLVFFNHLLSEMYLCSVLEAIYVCGYFSSRIDAFDDYLKQVNEMPPRASLGDSVNKHG